jgi:hypothetical protein
MKRENKHKENQRQKQTKNGLKSSSEITQNMKQTELKNKIYIVRPSLLSS